MEPKLPSAIKASGRMSASKLFSFAQILQCKARTNSPPVQNQGLTLHEVGVSSRIREFREKVAVTIRGNRLAFAFRGGPAYANGRSRIEKGNSGLHASNRGGTIWLDLDGKKLTDSLETASTKNDAAPLAWRQWHHWNVNKDLAVASLPKGKHVLTVHILSNGNMNLAYLDFKERKPATPRSAGEK